MFLLILVFLQFLHIMLIRIFIQRIIIGWDIYLILENVSYYIVGDSDITAESKLVKCDVLFVPIGGTYTTDYKEASELTNIIKPKVVVPVHYGIIVGEKADALKFSELVDSNIKCEIMY